MNLASPFTRYFAAGVVLASVCLVAGIRTATAQGTPTFLNYQGKLTSPGGVPVEDGTYTVTFKLFDLPQDGNLVWEETRQVQTTNGVFTVPLGQGSSLNPTLFKQRLFLQIEVGGKALLPRQELNSVAFAVRALSMPDGSVTTALIADAAVTSVKIASGAVNASKIAANAVTTTKIGDKAVVEAKLADGAVSNAKLLNDSVTSGKLGSDAASLFKVSGGALQANANSVTVSSGQLDLGSGLINAKDNHLHLQSSGGGLYLQRWGPGDVFIGGEDKGQRLRLLRNNAEDEGGEMWIDGGGTWPRWVVDSYKNMLRISAGGPAFTLYSDGLVDYKLLSKLDVAENPSAIIRTADLLIGHSGRRGTPGRALVDEGGRLVLNYGGDWPGVSIHSDLHVNGTLSKGGGSFKIDHPLDPDNKFLYHSFVESPDMKNVYDGVVSLDSSGTATVKLPDYFEALNRDFRYQLTCIGGYAPVYVKSEIKSNAFIIAGGRAGLKVSWQVTGIRQDEFAREHPIVPEVDKSASERGTRLYQPRSAR